jgi:hypothetical protein
VDVEEGMKAHSAAIESARTAISQTESLVERVVDTVESLQRAVVDEGQRTRGGGTIIVN